MPAPDVVRELVKRFEKNIDSYRSGKYNETKLRREFLDPLFEAPQAEGLFENLLSGVFNA